MSLGTLYVNISTTRGALPVAIVKHFGLDVKIVDPAREDETFQKTFPLKRIPTFVFPDGTTLIESLAVNVYCK